MFKFSAGKHPSLIVVVVSMIVMPLTALASLQAQGDRRFQTLKQDVQLELKSLLSHPLFVELDWKRFKAWQVDEYQSINLPSEQAEHANGVFRMTGMTATVWSSNPIDISVYGEAEFRVIKEDAVFKGTEQCKQNALKFLEVTSPQFFRQGALPIPNTEELDGNGIWHFKWQRYREDELPDTNISANVRAIDGKVVGFSGGKFVGPWEHKITPSQAKQMAVETASKKRRLKDVKITGWMIDGGGGNRFYDVGLQAQDKETGQLLHSGVQINAMTGDITESLEGWQPSDDKRDSRLTVEDQLPTWAGHSLLFVSDRKLTAMPSWVLDFSALID